MIGMRNAPALTTSGLLSLLPVGLCLAAVALLTEWSTGPGMAPSMLLAYAVSTCLATVFFAGPAIAGRREPLAGLLVAAGAAALFFAAAILDPLTRPFGAAAMPLALMLFLFTALALQLGRIAAIRYADSPPAVSVVIGVLFAVPVWLSPLAILVRDPWHVSDAIVALSPLSAFAAALEFDYLRTPWFYEHSVLGSLRYEYPAWTVYAGLFAGILALLTVISARRGAGHQQQETIQRIPMS
jgi:hypothetical protein